LGEEAKRRLNVYESANAQDMDQSHEESQREREREREWVGVVFFWAVERGYHAFARTFVDANVR